MQKINRIKKHICWRLSLLLLMQIMSIIVWGSLWLYSPASSVVSFDLQSTIHLFAEQVNAQATLTAQRKQQEIDQFSQALHRATLAYAKQHHVVILSRQALIAGAPDRTHAIQAAIALKMTAPDILNRRTK